MKPLQSWNWQLNSGGSAPARGFRGGVHGLGLGFGLMGFRLHQLHVGEPNMLWRSALSEGIPLKKTEPEIAGKQYLLALSLSLSLGLSLSLPRSLPGSLSLSLTLYHSLTTQTHLHVPLAYCPKPCKLRQKYYGSNRS